MRRALTVRLRVGCPAILTVAHAGPDTCMALSCVVCLAHPSRGGLGRSHKWPYEMRGIRA